MSNFVSEDGFWPRQQEIRKKIREFTKKPGFPHKVHLQEVSCVQGKVEVRDFIDKLKDVIDRLAVLSVHQCIQCTFAHYTHSTHSTHSTHCTYSTHNTHNTHSAHSTHSTYSTCCILHTIRRTVYGTLYVFVALFVQCQASWGQDHGRSCSLELPDFG